VNISCVLDVLCKFASFLFNLSGLAMALHFLNFRIVLCKGLMMICDSSISDELIMSCASGSFCCLMGVLRLFAFKLTRKVSESCVKSMICEVCWGLSYSNPNSIQFRIQSPEGLCLAIIT